MSRQSIAGVRVAAGQPLVWCACDLALGVGALVAFQVGNEPRIGRIVVAPDQLLDAPADMLPSGRVLRMASAEEQAAWEAARFHPTAGAALARDIERGR